MDFEELDSAIAVIEAAVSGFEPRLLDARGAVRAVERFSRLTHLGEAGTALAARRVEETQAFRESGARSAGHWLARKTGVAVSTAFRALETAEALAELPVTNEAFRSGRLSEIQAHEITGAARKDPSAEADLVRAARHETDLKGLKDRCRRVRAGAEADDAAWAQRLDDTRSLRTWVESDSAACGIWRMAPDKGAEVNAALDAETELLFREARAAGGHLSREAYAADALHTLVTRGPRKATGATVVMDARVAEQGFASRGQRCEIPGIGPIPAAIAQRMLVDAKVRAVPADPAQLPDYSTDQRYYPPWLLAWLEQRYPCCGQPGCDVDVHLEIDHVIPRALGGRTRVNNLWRLCWYHHHLKTNEGWRVSGPPHDWRLDPPDRPAGPDPP